MTFGHGIVNSSAVIRAVIEVSVDPIEQRRHFETAADRSGYSCTNALQILFNRDEVAALQLGHATGSA